MYIVHVFIKSQPFLHTTLCSLLPRYRLRPRVLRDVSNVDMRTQLLGEHVDFPIGVSPTALHCVAHPDGEVATAKGKLSN